MYAFLSKKTKNLFSSIKVKKKSGKKSQRRAHDMHKEDVEILVLKGIKIKKRKAMSIF